MIIHPNKVILFSIYGRDLEHREDNDCSVKAIAVLTEQEYSMAYSYLTKAGRERNKGFDIDGFIDNGNQIINGYKFRKMRKEFSTLGNFAAEHPTGSYMVLIRGHVLSVVEGKIVDCFKKLKSKVVGAYRVERTNEKATAIKRLEKKSITDFKIGDYVRFVNVLDRYMKGMEGRIIGKARKRVTVKLKYPIGRFKNGSTICPPECLEKIK